MNRNISETKQSLVSKKNKSGLALAVRKQNSQQNVGFDKEVAILKVGRTNRQRSSSPKIKWNSRWEDVNKLESPLERIVEHYVLDLRSQNKSMKTIDWYAANLGGFIRWLRRHKLPATLADADARGTGRGKG